jgi:hypothetical protein
MTATMLTDVDTTESWLFRHVRTLTQSRLAFSEKLLNIGSGTFDAILGVPRSQSSWYCESRLITVSEVLVASHRWYVHRFLAGLDNLILDILGVFAKRTPVECSIAPIVFVDDWWGENLTQYVISKLVVSSGETPARGWL